MLRIALTITTTLLAATSFESEAAVKPSVGNGRQTEESRFNREIAANLDWHNLYPEQLDSVDDDQRLLLARTNQSILLSKRNGIRFGIFEAFNSSNEKSYEVRLHTGRALRSRFATYLSDCNGPSLAVIAKSTKWILFKASCKHIERNSDKESKRETLAMLLFHFASGSLYALDSVAFENKPKVSLREDGGNYAYRCDWENNGKHYVTKHNFRIARSPIGDWLIKEPAVESDESGALEGVEPLTALPIDHRFDLPADHAGSQ